MKPPSYVKQNPKLFNYLPIIRDARGHCFPWAIYLRDDVYSDLKSNKPQVESLAVLVHEEVHWKREKKAGWVIFGLKYVLFRSFRFNEELIAYKEMMKIMKKNNVKFDFENTAKRFSSTFYQWATSYVNAKRELEKAWKEA